MLLLANLGEFAVHVRLLHHPRFPNAAYRRHSAHHSFFSYDAMAIDEARDLRWVLFPPWALPLMVLGLSPVFALLWSFAPTGSGWIFLLAAIVYYGVYEVFHALAHLPAHSFAAGWSWVRAITHHHRVHHDARWMLRYNFNFAIPIFDWAFGTLASSRRSVRPLAR